MGDSVVLIRVDERLPPVLLTDNASPSMKFRAAALMARYDLAHDMTRVAFKPELTTTIVRGVADIAAQRMLLAYTPLLRTLRTIEKLVEEIHIISKGISYVPKKYRPTSNDAGSNGR